MKSKRNQLRSRKRLIYQLKREIEALKEMLLSYKVAAALEPPKIIHRRFAQRPVGNVLVKSLVGDALFPLPVGWDSDTAYRFDSARSMQRHGQRYAVVPVVKLEDEHGKGTDDSGGQGTDGEDPEG